MFYHIPSCQHFKVHKNYCLPPKFNKWGHYECKTLDEASIKLRHSLEYLNLLWICCHKHEKN